MAYIMPMSDYRSIVTKAEGISPAVKVIVIDFLSQAPDFASFSDVSTFVDIHILLPYSEGRDIRPMDELLAIANEHVRRERSGELAHGMTIADLDTVMDAGFLDQSVRTISEGYVSVRRNQAGTITGVEFDEDRARDVIIDEIRKLPLPGFLSDILTSLQSQQGSDNE
jgi:hypothetical protein